MKGSEGNVLSIQTPEGVTFRLPIASPIIRMLACCLDLLISGGISAMMLQFLAPLAKIAIDYYAAITTLVYFLVNLLYSMVSEIAWRGQTPGKRMLKLRVVDSQGLRLDASQLIIRNLMRPADMLPLFYLVGGLVSIFHRYGQRLGDIAAGTVVIRVLDHKQPELENLFGGKFNSLAEHGHLAARLRQKISPNLASLTLEALLRRDALEPQARLALFAELAGYFKSQVPFPAEASEQLADEQYVRNVAEILFRRN